MRLLTLSIFKSIFLITSDISAIKLNHKNKCYESLSHSLNINSIFSSVKNVLVSLRENNNHLTYPEDIFFFILLFSIFHNPSL